MGMFDDLVPKTTQPATTGMFDDLVPPQAPQTTGMFDDLVPQSMPAAVAGGPLPATAFMRGPTTEQQAAWDQAEQYRRAEAIWGPDYRPAWASSPVVGVPVQPQAVPVVPVPVPAVPVVPGHEGIDVGAGAVAKPPRGRSQFVKSLETGGENVLGGLAGSLATAIRVGQTVPGGWYPQTAATRAAQEQTAVKLDQWAQRLYEDAQRPEMQPKKGSGPWQYIQHVTGQTLPFMATAMAAGWGAGPAGAFMVGAAVEGDNAYRDAISSGADEQTAQTERIIVGTLNGAIEQMQIGGLLKLGKAGGPAAKTIVKAARDRAWKKLASQTGKLASEHILNAVNEGLEESLQEAVGIGAATLHGDKIELADAARVGQAGLGGLTAGGILGGASTLLQQAQRQPEPDRPATAPAYQDVATEAVQPPAEIGPGGKGFTPTFQPEVPIIESVSKGTQTPASVDVFTQDEVDTLKGLGYRVGEIARMDVAEGRRRIADGEPPIRREAAPAVAEEAPAPAAAQAPAEAAEEAVTRISAMEALKTLGKPNAIEIDVAAAMDQGRDPVEAYRDYFASSGRLYGGDRRSRAAAERIVGRINEAKAKLAQGRSAPAQAAEEVTQRQAWEMTREEYRTTGVDEMVAQKKQEWDALSKEQQYSEPYNNPYESEAYIRGTRENDNLIHHKAQTQRAVADNKPVPRAVLEEYKGEPWADAALAKLGESGTMAGVTEGQGAGGQQTPSRPKPPEGTYLTDAGGKPQVFYHGAKGDFSQFRANQGMIWFTDNPSVAEEAADSPANIKQVYLKMENPLVLNGRDAEAVRELIVWLRENFETPGEDSEPWLADRIEADLEKAIEEEYPDGQTVRQYLGKALAFIRKKHDGVIFEDWGLNNYDDYFTSYVVFDAGQIASFEPSPRPQRAGTEIGPELQSQGGQPQQAGPAQPETKRVVNDAARRRLNTLAGLKSLTVARLGDPQKGLRDVVNSDPVVALRYVDEQAELDWEDQNYKRNWKKIGDYIRKNWPIETSPSPSQKATAVSDKGKAAAGRDLPTSADVTGKGPQEAVAAEGEEPTINPDVTAAIEAKNFDRLKELLAPEEGNEANRQQFERDTGVQLPETAAGTENTIGEFVAGRLRGGSQAGGTTIIPDMAAEVAGLAKDVAENPVRLVTAAWEMLKRNVAAATTYMRTLGAPGRLIARDLDDITYRVTRRANNDRADIREVYRGLSKSQRELIAKAMNGRVSEDALTTELARRMVRLREILDRSMREAAGLGMMRKVDGKSIPVGGKGKAYPQVPNARGMRFLEEAETRGKSSGRVFAWAQEQVKAHKFKSVDDAVSALQRFRDAQMRGVNRYLESTRVELPVDMIEWDGARTLGVLVERNWMTVEGVRKWGLDNAGRSFPRINSRLEAIRARHGADAAQRVKVFIQTSFGLRSPAGRQAQQISNIIRGYQFVTKVGMSPLTVIRNMTDRIAKGMMACPLTTLRASVEYPPFINTLLPWARRFEDRMIRNGVVFGHGALSEGYEAGGFFKELASSPFSESERGNQVFLALVHYHKLMSDLHILKAGRGRLVNAVSAVFGRSRGQAAERVGPKLLKKIEAGEEITEQDVYRFLHEMVSRRAFPMILNSKPIWYDAHPGMKVLAQFKTWPMRQVNMIWQDVVKYTMKTGDPTRLIGFMLGTLIAGEIYALIRDFLWDRDDSLVSQMRKSPQEREIAKAVLNDLVQGGMFGMLADLSYGIWDWAGGVSLSTGGNVLATIADIKKGGIRMADEAIEKLLTREVAPYRQAKQLLNKIDQVSDDENMTAAYWQWRAKAWEWERSRKAPGLLAKASAYTDDVLFGRPKYDRGGSTLANEMAARQIAAGDIEDAVPFIRHAMEQAADESAGLAAAKANMTRTSPLGPVGVERRELFLGALTPEQRVQAEAAQAKYVASYEKAIWQAALPRLETDELVSRIAANTYREHGRGYDMLDAHKGRESYVAALRAEYERRTGKAPDDAAIMDAQYELGEAARQKRLEKEYSR